MPLRKTRKDSSHTAARTRLPLTTPDASEWSHGRVDEGQRGSNHYIDRCNKTEKVKNRESIKKIKQSIRNKFPMLRHILRSITPSPRSQSPSAVAAPAAARPSLSSSLSTSSSSASASSLSLSLSTAASASASAPVATATATAPAGDQTRHRQHHDDNTITVTNAEALLAVVDPTLRAADYTPRERHPHPPPDAVAPVTDQVQAQTHHFSSTALEDPFQLDDDPLPTENTSATPRKQLEAAKQIPPYTLQSRLRPGAPTHITLSRPSASRDELPVTISTSTVMTRKVWVRRSGASATRVEVSEDDLVDNVRDMILRKYANSLGCSVDAPDITLKICAREQAGKTTAAGGGTDAGRAALERVLGPDEEIGRTLDAYYPGGQKIDEALIIDVAEPQRVSSNARKTPRLSPRGGPPHMGYYVSDEYQPSDSAREYFPPMPVALQSPHLGHVLPNGVAHHPAGVHSMAVLTTGQLPPLPSPSGHSTRNQRHGRPKFAAQHASSPTMLHAQQTGNGVESRPTNGVAPPAPPLPTPPAQMSDHPSTITPPNDANPPHTGRVKRRKNNMTGNTARSMNGDLPPPPKQKSAGLLDGTVPPISVLIVEDNVINLKLLEAFMKRLKVRWKSAMNGKEAVAMWRTGGFHLVLMDIQLPVMNGLEATKEIRRLEGVNGIGLGVFGGAKITDSRVQRLGEEDKLPDRSLFKSPVIIVALTASSLQSDRHEALAAGCNDFLTKPVNFVWMENKVTEWGCMQALIDFDGWRKWKEYAKMKEGMDPAQKAEEEKAAKAKTRADLRAMLTRPPPSVSLPVPDDSTKEANGAVKKSLVPSSPGSAAGSGTGTGTGAGTGTGPAGLGTPKNHKTSRSASGSASTGTGSGLGSLGSTAEEV